MYPDRQRQREAGIRFFMAMTMLPAPRIGIENPIGIMSTVYRTPDQIIQPYHFGDEAQKPTCLWLKGLPPLAIEAPLFMESKQCSPGASVVLSDGKEINKWWYDTCCLPANERARARSKTFQGIADAMAEQWGSLES